MNENTELALAKPNPSNQTLSVFGNLEHFESAQRMAKALCSSPMVPETYRGEDNIGSCLIALEMANRIGANVLSVCQNLYIVHGKPAWSSQFLIACINASGKFTPLRYRMTGDKSNDTFGCVAWATDKSGEKLESPEITIGIAKAEGWFQKNGSKWKTMPELMLRYRTATLFARLYAPEITLGIHTDDEVIDVVEVAPVVTTPVFAPKVEQPKQPRKKVEKVAVEAEVVSEQPKTEPAPAPQPEPTPQNEKSFEEIVDCGDSPEMTSLKEAMKAHEVTESNVLNFCKARGLLREGMEGSNTSDIRADKLGPLTKNILAAGDTLKKIKES